ncbi:hypothetical protein SODALDRAFT_355664 [Sodiomyces alkalinus F11]|uniref:Uncharacterized protein n=1 Tax=Sodiomyces alkalinus (strain CBS 110278 / VKM F-3762 / F11) TaxID=1314773 RepID=A0A3N2Q9X5_SODAK|nr:hypothetical protein SODALDRAFT_355664 [Sodiomyces alkalinus F11]ROT43458.1 hypothetical protein SODALDRAFT_355664 [Sodiomyces alkalinus F11]
MARDGWIVTTHLIHQPHQPHPQNAPTSPTLSHAITQQGAHPLLPSLGDKEHYSGVLHTGVTADWGVFVPTGGLLAAVVSQVGHLPEGKRTSWQKVTSVDYDRYQAITIQNIDGSQLYPGLNSERSSTPEARSLGRISPESGVIREGKMVGTLEGVSTVISLYPHSASAQDTMRFAVHQRFSLAIVSPSDLQLQ